MTFIEVVCAAALLALLAAMIMTAFNSMIRGQQRQGHRLAATELCNRLILQYLDDKKSLPSPGLPISYGPDLFRWSIAESPVTLVHARPEVAAERESRNALTLDRFKAITVRVWLASESGGSDSGEGGVVGATLTRLIDPIAIRNPDSTANLARNPQEFLAEYQRIGRGGGRDRSNDARGNSGRPEPATPPKQPAAPSRPSNSGRGGKPRRRHSPRLQPAARGFTVMETVLAAVIGGVIIVAALSIFYAMERTDRLLAARARQQVELQKVHLVMSRTFSTLLMSNAARPRAEEEDAESALASGRAPGRAGRSRAVDADDIRNPPARIILAREPQSTGLWMSPRSNAFGTIEAQPPQRLEVVLFDAPVPTQKIDWIQVVSNTQVTRPSSGGVRRAAAAAGGTASSGAGSGGGGNERGVGGQAQPRDPAARGGDAQNPAGDIPTAAMSDLEEDDASAPTVRAVRGAFELRPQRRDLPSGASQVAIAEADTAGAGAVEAWELWWIPVVDADPFAPRSQATIATEPFKVAQDLRYLRWRFFDDREKKETYSAIWRDQLPAYVEVEAQTTAGLIASWLFEVEWASGPETLEPEVSPVNNNLGADATAASGAGGTASEPKDTTRRTPATNRSGRTREMRQPGTTGSKGDQPK